MAGGSGGRSHTRAQARMCAVSEAVLRDSVVLCAQTKIQRGPPELECLLPDLFGRQFSGFLQKPKKNKDWFSSKAKGF